MSSALVGAAAGALARRVREDWGAWSSQVERTGHCVRPVRIAGGADAVDPATGEVLGSFRTADAPDGVLLVACGDRRSAVCPPCAERYRADMWHVVARGLSGRVGRGARASVVDGLPESVADHPAVFVTLTAPSFGLVHAARDGGACRPRRTRPVCEHGTARYCNARHSPDDKRLGEALCVECYDYTGHILWHSAVPELWRRFGIDLARALARQSAVVSGEHRTARQVREALRLSYVKVAEWQRRGAVHLHAVVRLDGRGVDGQVIMPPAWASRALLVEAVRDAAAQVSVELPCPDGRRRFAIWGAQLDVRPIDDPRRTAAYVAKYATKTASDTVPGLPLRPFRTDTINRLRRRGVSWHLLILARTCLHLSRHPACADLRLAENVHQLGFRGHYSSKSRLYSTTLRALGLARRAWRAAEGRGGDVWAAAGAEVVGDWRLVGVGHASTGDALLAEQLAKEDRIYREAVRYGDVSRVVRLDGEGGSRW